MLKANALASIPLGFCWLQVYYIGQRTLIGLLLPVAVSVLLKLVLLYKRYFPTLWNSNILDDTGEGENAADPTGTENGKTFFGDHRLVKFGRIGLEYVILPIFIYLLTYSASIHGNIDMFHEGERLAPLNEMLHGGVPFRDVYVQHGLFQNAYLAWFGSLLF